MATNRLRFGRFEFDPVTRELRRDGAVVRLQSQPSEVLGVLLANSGEVVTRDSLRQAIWGADTHVDFEGSLNFCIAQLRSALGDSAESSLYIKTVPKRGYQFIAAVTEVGGVTAPVPPLRSASRLRFVLAVVAGCTLGVAAWYGSSRVLRTPARGIRIAVARFENQSRDPSLDNFTDGLSDTFVAELTTASGGGFHVIGNAAVLRGARDRQDLRRIANDLQADFVVLGQVQRASDRGRVLIHLIRLPDQSHLWVTRVDDPDFGDPLTAERQIASRAVREFISKLPSPPPNTSR